MKRDVSTELVGRQGLELHQIERTSGRNAELAEELNVINDEVSKMAQVREFNDNPGAFEMILRSQLEREEAGS